MMVGGLGIAFVGYVSEAAEAAAACWKIVIYSYKFWVFPSSPG